MDFKLIEVMPVVGSVVGAVGRPFVSLHPYTLSTPAHCQMPRYALPSLGFLLSLEPIGLARSARKLTHFEYLSIKAEQLGYINTQLPHPSDGMTRTHVFYTGSQNFSCRLKLQLSTVVTDSTTLFNWLAFLSGVH